MLTAVTLSDAHPIASASVVVTRQGWCRNDSVFSVSGCEFYWRRWWAVTYWQDADGAWWATPDGCTVDRPWRVGLLRCASCRADFPTAARHRTWYCRACETARQTARQRARRERQRTPGRATCETCGALLVATRHTRRFCSGRCRTAALRARRRGADAPEARR